MITISLCMIVKDEEDVLERCLKSIAPMVDEIIIVDTGSTDRTKEIAARYTDKVFDFTWIDDFAAARNNAFSYATCDYCMWLDADDVIAPVDAEKLRALKQSMSLNIAVVMLPYYTGFDEDGNVVFTYERERIIKNNTDMRWVGAVHEVILPKGKVFYGDAAVSHCKEDTVDPERNLRIFEKQFQKGVVLDSRQQFYYGRELYYHRQYTKALQVFEEFLASQDGWVENKIDACCHKAYCYYGLEQDEKALQSLLQAMVFDLPRAEVCCDIGKHFLDRQVWKQAAFWYTLATTCKRDERRGGFISPDCYDYLPCIQLCVCYSNMGEYEKAMRFNELAGTFKPMAQSVLHNRVYFKGLQDKC